MGVDIRKCGTEAGYRRHRRAGSSPCQRCRDAHTTQMRTAKLARAAAGRECPECAQVVPTSTGLVFVEHEMRRVGSDVSYGRCPGSKTAAPRHKSPIPRTGAA